MKMRFKLFVLLCISILKIEAQQLAFPTAEGVGRFTSGGRGLTSNATRVFVVNSLADDGSAGTLRWALTQTATYRTIVFTVSGTIRLNSKLSIRANTTIAGQTAPAGGICIADHTTTFNGNNIIVRYIKFRLGDKNQLLTSPANCGVPVAPFTAACMPLNGSGGDDAFGASGYKNIMIDHCTFSWSNDEACSIYGGDSTTIQWCMISEPLNYSYHFETGDTDFEHHGFGGIWGGRNATFHHNLLAHCKGRACRFDGSRNLGNGTTVGLENCEFSNNIIYNWGDYNVNGGEGGNYNIRNNYYKFGPSTSTNNRRMTINPGKTTGLTWGKYFMSGNFVDGNTNTTNNNWLGANVAGGNMADTATIKVTTPFIGLGLTNLQTSQLAYTDVLKEVGASLPSRDTLDARIVNNVVNRTGRLIDCQGGFAHGTPFANTLNAWPTLGLGNVSSDNDVDGMPNWWEDKNALNKNLATDRALIATNGYTNLENYLNAIPNWYAHAKFETVTTTKVSSNQAQFNFTTSWVKDSFTYGLYRSSDSLGVYFKVAEVSSSMNNINFILNETSLPFSTTYYKIGSYRNTITLDTLWSNIYKYDGTVFPVKMKNYSVAFANNFSENNTIINKWETTEEVNVSHFNIQISSNRKEFETVGTIAAKGFGSVYEFSNTLTKNFSSKAIVYFRLQIIDKDGTITFSEIRSLKLNNKFETKVYPNPAKGLINIESSNEIKTIKILSILGKELYSKEYNLATSIQLPLNNISLGTYILQIINTKNESVFEKLKVD